MSGLSDGSKLFPVHLKKVTNKFPIALFIELISFKFSSLLSHEILNKYIPKVTVYDLMNYEVLIHKMIETVPFSGYTGENHEFNSRMHYDLTN